MELRRTRINTAVSKRWVLEYIDYKDPEFLMRFLNDQGKILPRRITGNFTKIPKKISSISCKKMLDN